MAYCEICKQNIAYHFNKDQLLRKSSDLYSGVFLHKDQNNEEIHAILAYFDNNFAHRGTEGSRVIQTDAVFLELVQKGSLSSSRDTFNLKKDIKSFYEWLINEYITFFKIRKHTNSKVDSTLIKYLASKRVNPVLNKILEDFRKLDPVYEKFIFSDTANSLIATTFQDKDLRKINENELKLIYQRFFDQIQNDFYELNKNSALETSRKLGIEIVNRGDVISKLNLPEDMLRTMKETNY
jgi:hypothetical protein